jgi:hypothetical protein
VVALVCFAAIPTAFLSRFVVDAGARLEEHRD